MEDVYIVGVGMTPFGKFLDKSVKQLTRESVSQAMTDTGARLADIESAYFSNTGQGHFEGQLMVGGEVALRDMGFEGIPIVNTENACASASTALYLAVQAVASGQSEVALAVGAEKMYSKDREKMFSVFDGAWDVATPQANYARLEALAADFPRPGGEEESGQRSLFMDVYAFLTRYHMKNFGTTQEHLAMVASKNHYHSSLNPLSQFQNTMTVEEVMQAREVSWPLTLPMCAPISDGSAAAIICNREALERFDRARAIKVCASVLASGTNRKPEEHEKHLCRLAANKAYDKAGVGPEDMSLAEVHDATAFAEILQTENLGFCPIGEGGALAASGATRLGGRIPVNVSGGLESKGHPIGATGLAQIYEMVLQLRGEAGERQVEGTQFAIAENGGGFYGIEEAAAVITILGKP
ncbi:MAG: thiolase family protein [Gammaproteobacteria bacterium]|nr:thiolase family protein [Gammaproteobacteria bacterium]